MTVGGLPEKTSLEVSPPSSSVSSSSTILTPCWPGVRLSSTSAPTARSRTAATKSLTTRKLTSASSSARRISRMARSRSASVSFPRERRSSRLDWSFSERDSNIRAREHWPPGGQACAGSYQRGGGRLAAPLVPSAPVLDGRQPVEAAVGGRGVPAGAALDHVLLAVVGLEGVVPAAALEQVAACAAPDRVVAA